VAPGECRGVRTAATTVASSSCLQFAIADRSYPAPMAGIISYGAYIPRLRLPLAVIGGGAPKPGGPETAVANWDEDSIAMRVAAAIDCLGDVRVVGSVGVAAQCEAVAIPGSGAADGTRADPPSRRPAPGRHRDLDAGARRAATVGRRQEIPNLPLERG
jgi:hypothetical protein